MDIQQVILGFLMEKSMTGYEIKHQFSRSFAFFSGLSYGSIYPALKKLAAAGLITTRREIQDAAPNRKICTITAKGRSHFRKALKRPIPVDRYKNAFLARLFFFAHLPAGERSRLSGEYLDSLCRSRDKLDAMAPEIEQNADTFQYLCFQCGRRLIADLIDNICNTRESLEAMEIEQKDI